MVAQRDPTLLDPGPTKTTQSKKYPSCRILPQDPEVGQFDGGRQEVGAKSSLYSDLGNMNCVWNVIL